MGSYSLRATCWSGAGISYEYWPWWSNFPKRNSLPLIVMKTKQEGTSNGLATVITNNDVESVVFLMSIRKGSPACSTLSAMPGLSAIARIKATGRSSASRCHVIKWNFLSGLIMSFRFPGLEKFYEEDRPKHHTPWEDDQLKRPGSSCSPFIHLLNKPGKESDREHYSEGYVNEYTIQYPH